MKPSHGVLAILLPLPNPQKPQKLPHPVQEGDRLQTGMWQQLLAVAPFAMPLSTLRSKKLILNFLHLQSGTHIAVFPSLEGVQKVPGGYVSPLLLSAQPAQRLDVFLGCDQSAIDLQLPALADEKCFKTLLAFADKPHLLAIDPEGQVVHINEGYYINRDNIRQASGLKRLRNIRLV